MWQAFKDLLFDIWDNIQVRWFCYGALFILIIVIAAVISPLGGLQDIVIVTVSYY